MPRPCVLSPCRPNLALILISSGLPVEKEFSFSRPDLFWNRALGDIERGVRRWLDSLKLAITLPPGLFY